MSKRQLKRILKQFRQAIADLYGSRLSTMILFGSQARGDAEPCSDIDILIVLKGKVEPGAEIRRAGEVASSLSLEHDLVISCLFMDEDRFLHHGGPLLRNIRREGIPL